MLLLEVEQADDDDDALSSLTSEPGDDPAQHVYTGRHKRRERVRRAVKRSAAAVKHTGGVAKGVAKAAVGGARDKAKAAAGGAVGGVREMREKRPPYVLIAADASCRDGWLGAIEAIARLEGPPRSPRTSLKVTPNDEWDLDDDEPSSPT